MRYEAPATVDQAVALMAGADGTASILAGGTDLLVQLRAEIVQPDLIIDIKHVPELRSISKTADGYVIGAAVTGAELEEHDTLSADWPGVVEATNLIGSTQIQGRCTLGGNLCNGSPAADSVPALIAAGAIANIAGPNGRRDAPVEDIMLAPRKLSLTKGEVIVSFTLPAKAPRSSDAYLRFIPRTEMDIAVVGCGIAVTLDGDGKCSAARVSLGAVAARPLLVDKAAATLIGNKLDEQTLANLDAAARAACKPINDKRGTIEFRTKIAGVLARRSAAIAFDRAGS